MNSNTIYQIICSWLSSSYLKEETLQYDKGIYIKAIEQFWLDYLRWYPNDTEINKDKLILTPQLHPILTYRIARLYFLNGDERTANIYSIIGRMQGFVEIYYSSQIGKGFKINHGIGSIIGARCIIGDNCTIHQCVTFGDKNGGRPIIGNNVIVYAGASIIGNIVIGDFSIVGANAVCLENAPEHSILVGSPAKNITHNK